MGESEASDGQEWPAAILRPMSDEERGRHPWYAHAGVSTVAICGATSDCEGWLAAVLADSAGTPRTLLIGGTHRRGQQHMWWAKRPPRRRGRADVEIYRAFHMAQVPLSGRPGRVKIQCPECFHFSRVVVPQPRRTRQ